MAHSRLENGGQAPPVVLANVGLKEGHDRIVAGHHDAAELLHCSFVALFRLHLLSRCTSHEGARWAGSPGVGVVRQARQRDQGTQKQQLLVSFAHLQHVNDHVQHAKNFRSGWGRFFAADDVVAVEKHEFENELDQVHP